MTATGFLFILSGIFLIINASNLVGVIKGDKRFNQTDTPKTDTESKLPTPTSGSAIRTH